MSKIRIKNFGPIRKGLLVNDGWLSITKYMFFIGNQGAGKSTIAKLISTFSWIEKALVRGDYDKKWFEQKNKLKNQYLPYHRLERYFRILNGKDITEIDYVGEAYSISYRDGFLSIEEIDGKDYPLPQIMYVPAERNFITYVKSSKELKLSSDSLKEFLTEYDNAKDDIKVSLRLPINNVDLEYDKLNDILNVKGLDYKVRLTEASSGFQSLVPLHLVSLYLANSVRKQSESKDSMSVEERSRFKKGVTEIWTNESFTDEQKRVALSVLSSKFNKTAFINIVEEPEQNLFPLAQWEILLSLIKLNNLNIGNKLIMTTHSPYIINYLSVITKANQILNIAKESELRLLNDIVPIDSTIHSDDLKVYELNESDGSIRLLETYNGLPSDENYLNLGLAKNNELFAKLLDLNDLCQK